MTAALHFNENAGREQATNRDGDLQYKIVFPKFKKGGFIVRKITTGCTYGRWQGISLVHKYCK